MSKYLRDKLVYLRLTEVWPPSEFYIEILMLFLGCMLLNTKAPVIWVFNINDSKKVNGK